MGGSNVPRPPNLPAMFAGLQAEQHRQATSPNASYSRIQGGALQVTDPNGAPKINTGSYTFTSGPYQGRTISAVVTFDAMGYPLLVQGQQPDGSHGFGVYNQLGVKVVFLGAQGLIQYDGAGNILLTLSTTGLALLNAAGVLIANLTPEGLASFDAGGQPRSIVGKLPSGDYGLGVYPIGGGTVQEVLPLVTASQSGGTANTSGYAYIGPTVTAAIGSSGRCQVRSSAYLGLAVPNMTAKGGIAVDGNAATIYAESSLSDSGSDTVAATVSAATVVTGLSPGSHTFGYWAAATGTSASATIANIEVEVQPL